MRLDQPPVFALVAQDGNHLTLRSPEGAAVHLWVLEEDIVRVLLLPSGSLQQPRTWAIAPGLAHLPFEGRDRFDLSGFSLPAFELGQVGSQLRLATSAVRLTVELEGFFCRWESHRDGRWQATAADRPTQGYNFGWWDQRVYHYLQREPGEAYYGLGERSGDANRAGQRYRMCNLDPMGYSARSTDPLYKHIPFYITRKSAAQHEGLCFGLFYDTLSDCTFDMGREMDNYHGHYRSFVADHGDLDLYYIAGRDPAAITRRYTWLTGRPAFPPRLALGYSGSTMTYTDAPNAQQRMGEFLDRCEEHDIACDSFHLSSGYTSIGDGRYVFHWNRDKFPDPEGFVRSYRERGVHLVANIKPALLRDHPRFAEAHEAGLLVHDPDGRHTAVQFWDGTGAYLDFTNPDTIAWWRRQVTEQLLQPGISATWNDNNEFEIWSDQARIHGFGTPRAARELRPLQTLLMIQASHAAQTAFAPGERPYLVSRAGAPGMQRYVQTWSGDNYTSWETLRYNIRMGLGLAMSGVSNTGHDIGGFSGPAPDPELFVRWVQHGIFLPRFSIHSWNDDKTVNEPWMYPQATPQVRELIRLRYRLMPYLYDLVWRYHRDYEPIIRPTYHDFPSEAQCHQENDDMLLGAHLLVASVVEPGQTERRVWLPGKGAWFDWHSARRFEAGQWVTLDAALDGPPPLLAREGCAVPLNLAIAHFGQVEDLRGFQLFPYAGQGGFEATCFEDDGHSTDCLDGGHGQWRLRVSCTPQRVQVDIAREGQRPPLQEQLVVRLPSGDTRTLDFPGAAIVHDRAEGAWRSLTHPAGCPCRAFERPLTMEAYTTDRAALLARLGDAREWDLVVIGGGATGLGVAVDAAARGFSVALVEATDFAKGTSSRATKLVHGGVRYLAQGNVSLVREALRERATLLANAPHLAQPLPFVMPAYHWWEPLFYGVGLKAYDALAGRRGLGPTAWLSARGTVDLLPNVQATALSGGVKYWDAQFDDARLAVTLARTAIGLGAVVLNHCPATGLLREGGRVRGVAARDAETGTPFSLRARCVVNATGVWVDAVRDMDRDAGTPSRAPMVAPSQGVHLVVDRDFLPGGHALIVPKTSDGRVLFAVPWLGKTILGTTDTPRADLPAEPEASEDEIGFILHEAAGYLAKPPRRDDVRSVWAGLRPLVRPTDDDSGSTQAISREHTVVVGRSGLVTVTGGKWTTYRAMAEDVLERCFEARLLARRGAADATSGLRLAGAPERAQGSITQPPGEHLYGSEVDTLRRLPGADRWLWRDGSGGFSEAMLRFAVRHEMARSLEDVLAWRCRLLFLDAARAQQLARPVAALLQEELGRPVTETEIADFEALAGRYRGRAADAPAARS